MVDESCPFLSHKLDILQRFSGIITKTVYLKSIFVSPIIDLLEKFGQLFILLPKDMLLGENIHLLLQLVLNKRNVTGRVGHGNFRIVC